MTSRADHESSRNGRSRRRPRSLEGWVLAYVDLRSTLGFTDRSVKQVLRNLILYVRDRRLGSFDRLDRATCTAWLRSGSVGERRALQRLTIARGFFSYLTSLGAVPRNIWDSLPSPKEEHVIPYIYTPLELRQILDALRGGIDPRKPRAAAARYALYAMVHTLYACGLRAQEICRLTLGDMDDARSLFVVRRTKFGKTRLVPYNRRTRELLAEYLRGYRPRGAGTAADSPLFLNFWHRAFSPGHLGEYFRRVIESAGLYRPKRSSGHTSHNSTNLHSFRHTFAVHRLLKWYADGADVNAKLPLLSTYMGHRQYTLTQRYLTVLPRFTGIARDLFAKGFERPLGELE